MSLSRGDFETRGVPGQSLTSDDRPWTVPPQLIYPEEVLNFYMDTISKPESGARLLGILDRGYPIDAIVDNLLGVAVMEGLHTLDTGIIAAPAIHRFIEGLAQAADVQAITGLEKDTSRPNISIVTRAIQEAAIERQARQDETELRERESLDQVVSADENTDFSEDIYQMLEQPEARAELSPLNERGLMQRPIDNNLQIELEPEGVV